MSDTVTLSGRLSDNPDLHFTNSGQAVVNFTLIVTTGAKREGEQYAPSAFLPVAAWNNQSSKLAENVAESLKKGDRVIVTGKLVQDNWEDGDGNKRSAIKVQAFEVGADLAFTTITIPENERTGRSSKPANAGAPDWS